MHRILVPLAGSENDSFALQAVIKRFKDDPHLEVHLLNVQAPFPADVAHFTSGSSRHELHEQRSAAALAPAQALLHRHGVPHAVHHAVGERAVVITSKAKQLGCDEILMATARKSALARWVENSVTDKVLQLTTVPVEVVAGKPMAPWERWGIPAAVGGAALALLAIDF